jgi:Domain of unknown function (DUF4342)
MPSEKKNAAKETWETFKVKGDQLLQEVKAVVREGNARRVVIKQGTKTLVEFPVTVGVVGAVAAPVLIAVGALAAVLTECTIEVQREGPAAAPTPKAAVVRVKVRARSRK